MYMWINGPLLNGNTELGHFYDDWTGSRFLSGVRSVSDFVPGLQTLRDSFQGREPFYLTVNLETRSERSFTEMMMSGEMKMNSAQYESRCL